MPVYTKLFLLFFFAVFFSYYMIRRGLCKNKPLGIFISNLILLLASLVFYGWSNLKFIIFPIAIGIICYLSGIFMDKAQRHKMALMHLFIVLEISPLIIYKIIGLWSDIFELPYGNIIIPLGLSFFSLQAVTYTHGIYEGTVSAEKNPLIVILFISFFPFVSSGPIQRAANLLPQFKEAKEFDYEPVSDGLRLMGWGLLKKLVIADNLAMYIQAVRGTDGERYGTALLLTAILYSFQLYLDFSGYSDIVIGCAGALGFKSGANFDHPYLSASVGEFWRRWHISLSSWLRDYVYIPLGGGRVSKARKMFNTLVTFSVSGLWHGAGLTWIVWGLYHGVCLCIENILGIGKKTDKNAFRVVRTFLVVSFGWIIFSAGSFGEVLAITGSFAKIPGEIAAIAGGGLTINELLMVPKSFNMVLCMVWLLLFIIISLFTAGKPGLEFIKRQKTGVRWSCYFALALMILFFSAENSGEFIYNMF